VWSGTYQGSFSRPHDRTGAWAAFLDPPSWSSKNLAALPASRAQGQGFALLCGWSPSPWGATKRHTAEQRRLRPACSPAIVGLLAVLVEAPNCLSTPGSQALPDSPEGQGITSHSTSVTDSWPSRASGPSVSSAEFSQTSKLCGSNVPSSHCFLV
jgi:hypothetical protein